MRRRFGRDKSWLFALSLGLALLLLGVVVGRWSVQPRDSRERLLFGAEPKPASESLRAQAAAGEVHLPTKPSRPVVSASAKDQPLYSEPEEPLVKPARLALVIDDLGRSLEVLDQLEALGIELSFSVLPFESRTQRVVKRLQERHREILLHLPMEAGGAADPGPGALLAEMSPDEWLRRIDAALAAVPQAVGVNNHMGSLLSSQRDAMKVVMASLGRRGLFFLDSRTSPRSVGYEVAQSLGLFAARRDVFLDGERSVQNVRAQFERWLQRAEANGYAIAIAHPYPETLSVLAEQIPRAKKSGYTFVAVSRLMRARSQPSLQVEPSP